MHIYICIYRQYTTEEEHRSVRKLWSFYWIKASQLRFILYIYIYIYIYFWHHRAEEETAEVVENSGILCDFHWIKVSFTLCVAALFVAIQYAAFPRSVIAFYCNVINIYAYAYMLYKCITELCLRDYSFQSCNIIVTKHNHGIFL